MARWHIAHSTTLLRGPSKTLVCCWANHSLLAGCSLWHIAKWSLLWGNSYFFLESGFWEIPFSKTYRFTCGLLSCFLDFLSFPHVNLLWECKFMLKYFVEQQAFITFTIPTLVIPFLATSLSLTFASSFLTTWVISLPPCWYMVILYCVKFNFA